MMNKKINLHQKNRKINQQKTSKDTKNVSSIHG